MRLIHILKTVWTKRSQGPMALSLKLGASTLRAAMAELSLTATTTDRLAKALETLRASDAELVDQLERMIAEGATVQAQYDALSRSNPEVLAREKPWLAELITESLGDDTTGWAALYLAFGHKNILVQRVDHILNPRSHVQMPSAFVYAMQ